MSVHLIEPGSFRTPIVDIDGMCSKLDESFQAATPSEQLEYGEEYVNAGEVILSLLSIIL